jgi:hypothetical protein
MTKRSEKKIKAPLAIRGVEMQQRAENGGWPLPNETAGALDLGHGTPLLVVSQRSLVQYLHRVVDALERDANVLSGHPPAVQLFDDTLAMLVDWDTFLTREGLGMRPEKRR